jgi:RNA polymerase sigma factor (sigma-70 family)
MTTIITNYTTYDLAYYYADLKRLPRLSPYERQRLVTGLSGDPISPAQFQDVTQLKQQLIESYLSFAKHLAITLCPPALYRRLLPELIGAVNLAAVEAVMRADLSSTLSLDAYVAAYVRAAIKRTLSTDDLLPLPAQARERAKAEGTLDQLRRQYRVTSLDACMEWFDPDAAEEPLLVPLLPTQTAPERDPALRTQVDTLLSYLSPRARAILRLRYGLSDDNERCHSTDEIAALTGIDRGVVRSIERDALTRLRAFVTGKATLGRKNGKPCICYPDAHNTSANTPEQEAALLAAYDDLQARDIIVTGRSLADAAGTSVERAWTFLRRHRSETPTQARARQRQRKLERACARLEAQGVHITSSLLAKEAGVAKQSAIDFLTARRSMNHATA